MGLYENFFISVFATVRIRASENGAMGASATGRCSLMLSTICPAFCRSENGIALRPSVDVLVVFAIVFETPFCSGRPSFRGTGESEKSAFRLMLPFRRGRAFGVSSSSLQ